MRMRLSHDAQNKIKQKRKQGEAMRINKQIKVIPFLLRRQSGPSQPTPAQL